MVSVQQVFDMAIHLIDEQNEATGATVTVDTAEYRYRTISILNTAIPRLYAYSGTFRQTETGRPAPRQLYTDEYNNPDFDQSIPLDDVLALSVLPLYLAGQLVSAENTELAAWCMNLYRETLNDVRNKVPADFAPIANPYGTF